MNSSATKAHFNPISNLRILYVVADQSLTIQSKVRLPSQQLGSLTAEAMFQQAEESNRLMTWILRFVGCLLMFFGIAAILRPLSVLADVVPLFGNIVGAGTSIIALLIAALFSLLTIGVAWIVYRPLIGAAVLAVAAAVVFLIVTRMKKGKAAAPAAQPPPPPLAAGS